MSASKVRVTLTRSPNGEKRVHHATLAALGLGKIGTSRVHEETPSFCGMIRKVAHLVSLEPLDPGAVAGPGSRSRRRSGHGRARARVVPGAWAVETPAPAAEAPAEAPSSEGVLAAPVEEPVKTGEASEASEASETPNPKRSRAKKGVITGESE